MSPALSVVVDDVVIDIPTQHPATVFDERVDTRCRKWAERIGASLQQSVAGIIEAGRLLAAAKADLDHGHFYEMLRVDLHLGHRTAQKLMSIAANEVISDASRVTYLPPALTTLYELSRWDPIILKHAVRKHGAIRPDTKRSELEGIRRHFCRSFGMTPGKSKSAAKTLTPQPISFFKTGQRLFSPAQIKAMNSLDDGLKAELWLKFAEQIYPLLEDEQLSQPAQLQQEPHQHD